MNEIILIAEIVIVFTLLLLANRFFGEVGVTAWIAIASVLANVITAKNAAAFGVTFTLGSVMFASTFLATDILTERFGIRSARRGVMIGMFATITLIISTQIALLYTPSAIDYADGAMQTLFSMNLRISISSVIMYFIANMADVFLYERMKEATKGKAMWLRNNVSTILCNCLENFFFMFFAFYGLYGIKDVVVMALSTSVVEIIAGLCDTPFLYMATRKERALR